MTSQMMIQLACWLVIRPIMAQGWVARWDGAFDEQVTGLATDSQGCVYAVGYFVSSTMNVYDSSGQVAATLINRGSNDAFIVKYALNGSFMWIASQSGINSDVAGAVVIDSSDNIVIAGSYQQTPLTVYSAQGQNFTQLPNHGLTDAYVVKYTSSGQFLWIASLGGSNFDYGMAVAVDSDNNVLLVGYYKSSPFSVYDSGGALVGTLTNSGITGGYLVQYFANGSFSWATRQDGTGGDQLTDVAVDRNGQVYISGLYQLNPLSLFDKFGGLAEILPNSGNSAGFVAKYFGNGSFAWSARQDGAVIDFSNSVTVDAQFNFYVAGYYSSNPLIVYDSTGMAQAQFPLTGFFGSFLVKYNLNGSVAWALRLAGAVDDKAAVVTADNFGNVLIAGTFKSSIFLIYNINGSVVGKLTKDNAVLSSFIVKYTSTGQFLWAVRIDGSGSYQAQSLHADSAGSVYVGGYYSQPLTVYDGFNQAVANLTNSGSNDGFIVKYNYDGSYQGIVTASATLPERFPVQITTQVNSSSSSTGTLQAIITSTIVTSSSQFVGSVVPLSYVSQQISSTVLLPSNPALLLTFTFQSQQLPLVSTTTHPSTENIQSNSFKIQLWVWIVIGVGAILLIGMTLLTCFYCIRKRIKPQSKPDYSSTMLDESMWLSNGTTMLNQTIPMGDGTTMLSRNSPSNPASVNEAPKPKYESFTQVVPADQGNEPYLTQSD